MKQAASAATRAPGRPLRDSARRLARSAHAGALLCALAAAAQAQSVTFNGMLGDRALLVIDGRAQTLAVGASAQGVKLLRLGDNQAQVEIGGQARSLRLGGTVAGSGAIGATNGSRIVLAAGPGGHYTAAGSINGHAVQFLVDTGATTVSLGSDEAARIGLDLSAGTATGAMTANGAVAARSLTLTSVRVGDVTLADVRAVVLPQAMPYVLLGNSFLSRFNMHSDNDTLVLERK